MATSPVSLNLFPVKSPIGYVDGKPVTISNELYRAFQNTTERLGGASGTETAGFVPNGVSGGIVAYIGAQTLVSSPLLIRNALLLGGGAGATPTSLPDSGASDLVLHGNENGVPSWLKVDLTTTVTSILPESSGGTGGNTYTTGDILYSPSTNRLTRLSGNATVIKKYLSQTGSGIASNAPAWSQVHGNDVIGAALTKVDDANVTATLSGNPADCLLRTTNLILGWSGQLSGSRGGTGVDNTGKMLTLGGDLSTVGAFSSIFNITGNTNVTFPTSGTLAATSTTIPSIAGTTNQVFINGGISPVSGIPITLSLPQDIATTSSPTLSGLTLTGFSGVLKASAGVLSGSATTTNLPEGTNLYFTNNRAAAATYSYILDSATIEWADFNAIDHLIASVSDNSITFDKMQQISSQTFLGRNTAGTGNVEGLSIATSKTMLNLAGTNTGNVTLAGFNYLTIVGQVITANQIDLGSINVGGILPEIKGGTAQVSYITGDTLFASAINTLSKLPGNTAAIRKFLRQTGTGTLSAAPDWDTIIAADIPGSALTKVDDTNVTLTLGGSPSNSVLNAVSLTLGWAGQLSGSRGGTGINNSGKTITLGGNLTTSGAFNSTFTMIGGTAVTFPTSGTLAITSQTVPSIAGTTSQVFVNGGVSPVTGTPITLSLPQNIAPSNSPTFVGLTLSGLTNKSIPYIGGSGVISQNNSNLWWDEATTTFHSTIVSASNTTPLVKDLTKYKRFELRNIYSTGKDSALSFEIGQWNLYASNRPSTQVNLYLTQFDDTSTPSRPVISFRGDISVTDTGSKVGIVTQDPRTNLEVAGVDGILSTGTLGSGVVLNLGGGTRFHWYPKKGALRAGTVTSTEWNDANIGNNSVGFGSFGIFSGENVFGAGYSLTLSADNSGGVGFSNSIGVGANNSFVSGNFVNINGANGFSSGKSNTTNSNESATFGVNNSNLSYASLYAGRFPILPGSASLSTWVASDPLFVLGNGADGSNRANAVTILKNGNTDFSGNISIAQSATINKQLIVNGTGTIVTSQFGSSKAIYAMQTVPVIGFNMYFESGWFYGVGSASEYGGAIAFSPSNGLHSFSISSSAGNQGNAASPITTLTTSIAQTKIYSTVAATSATTGALTISGGASFNQSCWFDSNTLFNNYVIIKEDGSATLPGTMLTITNKTSPAIAGNIYGFQVIKNGYEGLFLGINKNTTTGEIPANNAYISTFGSSGICIGRGNGSGSLSTADIQITPTGAVKNPHQLAFNAYLTTLTTAPVTGNGTIYQIICDGVVFNVGGGYNSTTGIFTATYTGQYMFTCAVTLIGVNGNDAVLRSTLLTSNGEYLLNYVNPHVFDVTGSLKISNSSIFVDMDAGDIAYYTIQVTGPNLDIQLGGGNSAFRTYFSASLIN